MSYDVAIYTAFADRVGTFAAARALPVAWPGVHFTPPETGAWLEVKFVPNETRDLGLGTDFMQARGFGQVTCYARPGAGIVDPLTLAGEVIAAFPKGTPLGAATVERQPWVSSVLTAPDLVLAYVTIRYSGGVST